MPKPSYRSITISKELYEEIRQMAKERHHTPHEMIQIWVEQERELANDVKAVAT